MQAGNLRTASLQMRASSSMQSLNELRRAPSVTWQERGHPERARSASRRSRRAIRESASLHGPASREHSPDSGIHDILTPHLSNGRDALGLHGGSPQEPGFMHSHADAVRSYIRDGRGSAILHSTADQDLYPRDSPEGSRPSLSGGRDAVGLHSAAPQQLSHNSSADATDAPRSSVDSDRGDAGLRSAKPQESGHIICSSDASRAHPMDGRHTAGLPAASALQSRFASSTASPSYTEALRPALEYTDHQRPASEGGSADSALAAGSGEAAAMDNVQKPQPMVSGAEEPQLRASQPPVHHAALTMASSYSADEGPDTSGAAAGTLHGTSSDAMLGLSDSEAAEEPQLLEGDDMPDLSGLWADAVDWESAVDRESQDGHRDELCSSKASEEAQVLQLYGELKACEETAHQQELPCLSGPSSLKMVQKARLSQRDDNADISGYTEDIIPVLFWEAQEAHISAMHAELDSSLAGDVDIKSWASKASSLPTAITHAQLEEEEEQGDEGVSQSLGTAIPDNLQQEVKVGSSREALLSIAAVMAAAMPVGSCSLPCAPPLAVTPDITLQAAAMDVPCTGARDSLMPAPKLCSLAPVSGAAAQQDTTAASSSQKGLQRGKGPTQRTGRSAKKGCSTRPAIRSWARGQGPAKAAARNNDKAEILAAIVALQMAVSEQAASIAQLKEELWMKGGQASADNACTW